MPFHIVSLGSSFAAGPGIPPQINKAAMRSGSNYAHVLANRLISDGGAVKLTDLTVSGATLLNVLQEPQTSRGQTFPAQVDHVPGNADVVLITGGGNDLGYIGDLILDSLKTYRGFRLLLRMYNLLFKRGGGLLPGGANTSNNNDKLDQAALTERYGKVLDAIHAKAPSAHVVVVEYLTLLGADAQPGVDVPLSAEGVGRHQAVAERLRIATGRAISGREAWCSRISVAEPSWSHGLGSKVPWVFGFGLGCLWRGQLWYHPNAAGMEAVAEMVHGKLEEIGVLC
ncbi:hypothetical protein N0V82_005466 [Gnomoniopsis sp. IMI 355080]|nr:hypothetical protein N0V82_005466 [Gnomoniopsis sp. IMI 355080]